MDDTEYDVEFTYNLQEPADYILMRQQRVREDAWLKILNTVILKPECKGKHIVISFEDKLTQITYDRLSYRVRFIISLAREQQITFLKMEDLPTRAVFHSAIDELKYRIHSKWHKFWNTERVKRG